MKIILSKGQILNRDVSPEQCEEYNHDDYECVDGAYCPCCKGIGVLPVRDIWDRVFALWSALDIYGHDTEAEILKSVMEVMEK